MDNTMPFYAELMDLKAKRQTVQGDIQKFLAETSGFREMIDTGRADYRQAIERGDSKAAADAMDQVKCGRDRLDKAGTDFEMEFQSTLAEYQADADKLIATIKARNDEIAELVKNLAALSMESESNRQRIPGIQAGVTELRLAIDAGLTAIQNKSD